MIVDLWAKAYDAPVAQRLAKAILTALAATTLGYSIRAAAFLIDSAGGIVSTWITLEATALVLSLVLWTIHFLDWRGTYVGGLVGILYAVLCNPGGLTIGLLTAGGLPALAIVVMSTLREWPARKLTRYSRMLERDCCCCGFKQRAVHELSGLGAQGEEVVRAFMSRASSRYQTRVAQEWRRCRPT